MLEINDYVKITNTKLKGFVIKKVKDFVFVDINNISIKIKSKEVEKIDIEKKIITNSGKITTNFNIDKNFIPEIMLRHQFVNEALSNLDKFIDSAIIHKEKRIKIIHGKHGGILRKAVENFLINDSRIKSFELGQFFEGSYGVTIAYIH